MKRNFKNIAAGLAVLCSLALAGCAAVKPTQDASSADPSTSLSSSASSTSSEKSENSSESSSENSPESSSSKESSSSENSSSASEENSQNSLGEEQPSSRPLVIPECEISGSEESGAVKFTFSAVPESAEQLMGISAASLDSPFKTAALTMLALLEYEKSPEKCFEMLNALKGPEPLSDNDKNFINERLENKGYVPRSYFAGATVANSYTPDEPFCVEITSNPYSFTEENWATLFIKSAGADSPRQLKLRKKPSEEKWYLSDIQCLSDIRLPANLDPWA